MTHRYKFLMVLLVSSLLASCKLAVIVVEGGEVLSNFGPCTAGNVCIHDVPDTNFSEFFYAQPEAGWEFVRWNSGKDFWCKDSTDRICELSLQGLAGIAPVEDIVASTSTFYIMPVFQPIPPTVVVDGKEWYQPIFFTNLTWDEVNATCQAGVCNGTLNGHDLNGWTWASSEDMDDLFNHYIGGDVFGGGNTVQREVDSSWAPAFFASGWRWHIGLHPLPHSLHGWIAADRSPEYGGSAFIVDSDAGREDLAVSWSYTLKEASNDLHGAWFYRAVP